MSPFDGAFISVRAFTFVEMLIVVAVLAICAAVVVPMAGRQADVRLGAASRKVLGDVAYAQSLAVASRRAVYVRFASNRYDVCTLVGTALTTMPNPVDQRPFTVTFGAAASESALRSVTLAAPSFGAGGDRVLGFDAAGQPFAFAETLRATTAISTRSTIALASDGSTLPVYVEALTGELHVP